MKILLHGDNHVASRHKLHELIQTAKKSGQEIIRQGGTKATETDLHQALESHSLFGGEKLVVVEKFLSRPRSKEKDHLLGILNFEKQTNVIMWESTVATPATLKKLNSFTQELFKTPASIFKFLDALAPQQPQLVLSMLHQSLPSEAAELILYLVSRRVSDLIIAHDTPQLLVQAPWLKGKLQAQAKKFTLDQLIHLHSQFLFLEESHKTGTNILALDAELDLLLAKL